MLERLRAALQDRYRVEREAGAGGMATVFVATDLKHQRTVAIKVLRPELAAAIGPDRFLREIEIAAKLQHPHILPVYDSGQADGLLYYVMPFVEGESLRDRLIRGGALTAQEAVRFTREIADALAYAHRQGIVHRDIKPANILLSQGHAVVADFGIARAVSASTQMGEGLTQAGAAIGTPAYMSPEQALGDANVDGHTDVYSLGIVLYEMLSGTPPFVGTTPQAILGQTLKGSVPRLARDSLALQPVIERAMAKEPADRFNAAELSARLDAVSTTGTGLRVPDLRRPRSLLTIAAVAVVAVLAVAFWPREYRALGDPRKSLIIFPFDNKTGDRARDYLSEAAMNLLGLAAAHWQDMRVFDDERTASLMRRRGGAAQGDIDFEDARAMAREARVGTVVVGDLRREGDSLAIEAKVHDVRSGDRLQTVILRAPWDADPRPLFDQLAGRILGTSGAPPGEAPSVLAQTTSSIEAYRAYLAGTGALQRFQIDSAKLLLGRAVELDSNFALAYIRLRDADGWGSNNDPERRRRYVMAAERHSASLPPRLRSLVQYHRAYMDGQFQEARRVAEGMIRLDSTDVEAWYQLGEAHYHHGSLNLPHADTMGNLGLALRAFQHTLALDSTYVLAYQHILDALRSCADNGNRIVCLGDSAYYGQPADLERRFGRATIDRQREHANAAQITTGRGWVAAVPGSVRPRHALLNVLYTQRRYDEALTEAGAMEALGWAAEAGFLKGMVLFQLGRADSAATTIELGLKSTTDTSSRFQSMNDWTTPPAILAAAGRLDHGLRLDRTVFMKGPFDSLNGPNGVRAAKGDFAELGDWFIAAEAGRRAPGTDRGPAARELRGLFERMARGDSTRFRRIVQSFGSLVVNVFLATRDTALLPLLLANVDTLNSSTWRVADAHLALARGDTARARLRIERHYRNPDVNEFNGEQGIIRTVAWADLFTRLHQPDAALGAYARLDSSDARIIHPGALVRSWAERGALHQQLGHTADAIRDYERFIAAWQHADPDLRPQVDKARAAVAALKGEPRRQPGDNP